MATAETVPSPPSSSYENQYPSIDPTTFDLIVCGTGLYESLLSAAAASAAKSVLHVDPNPFYGSHFSSLSLPSLASFLHPVDDDDRSPLSSADKDSDDDAVFDLLRRRLYSDVETSGSFPEPSKGFLVDLAGPRFLYCSDAMVDLLLRSGASNHVEFKSVDATLIYWEGKLCPVPDSREAIFRDRTLGLAEKSQLTKFLRLIQNHIASEESGDSEVQGVDKIPPESMEMPFSDFLKSKRLPPKIRAMIIYAIILANYDQEDVESCKKLIKTKDGIESLALYTKSVARFPNAVGAFLYPIFGHGELPQAFCRCAAVKGALYVLRMPVTALLIDKETGKYKGVRLGSGQDVFSNQVIMDPSFKVPSSIPPGNIMHKEKASSFSGKVAKGICITSGSILPDSSNVLVVFPPKSLYPEQSTAIQVLQLSQNVAVCPPGLFVVYLSTPCNDAILGKEHINAAKNALFLGTEVEKSDGISLSTNSEGAEGENKPVLKWSITYVQDQEQASFGAVCSCPMPDENLDYRCIMETTKKLFTTMYPEEEFFPASRAPDNTEEDDSLPE
ncbi:rab escort protein 1 [Canna indica]|uniref:Rab escort protein 1 n=1 Tax=Canna indica TaxID=4628 RepID=A0AAQ3QI32_9LILI|nr:rab escort protein 1 [Canna indica]